jgi:MrfA Zn-binding domain
MLPLLALAAASVAAVAADRLAAARRHGGDRGDFWVRVFFRTCLLLGPPLAASAWLETLAPTFWRTGRHLFVDLTGGFGWRLSTCLLAALAVPVGAFLVLLAVGQMEKPAGREAGRALAGSLSSGGSRAWVLALAAPLGLLLITTWPRLGKGAAGYPGAVWATLLALSLALVGVATSRGREEGTVTHEDAKPTTEHLQLPLWPAALAARGIELTHLASFPARPPGREVRGARAGELAERLRLSGGGRSVAPKLIEAVADLLEPGADSSGAEPTRLVLAPDGSGQVEAVALLAQVAGRRSHTTALVVTARGSRQLAAQLARWLPAGSRAVAVERTGELPEDALIWVADAAVLSDGLLPQLKDPQRARRIGLVVWWSLEKYSGVLAANLWAISRRLDRLLRVGGHRSAPVLALVRDTPYPEARLASFVRQLLPHPFPATSEVHVERCFPRSVHLHLLGSTAGYFARGEGRTMPARLRFPTLAAARVSVEEGWPTHLDPPPDLCDSEIEEFLQLRSGERTLEERLEPSGVESGAHLLRLEAGDVLALPQLFSQGGRAAAEDLPHHAAFCPPENPYARYLLAALRAGGPEHPALATSRRLVCAEAHPTLLRRHLLLALNEVPATHRELLETFLWEEDRIEQTLEDLSREGQLSREEIRSLDERGHLAPDRLYRSLRPPEGEFRPLDTVGVRLIVVREPAGGAGSGGVRMQVDPERLTIQAYPHRVFLHRGRRYRIREWSSPEEVWKRGWLPCELEERYGRTWRIRHASVFGVRPIHPSVGIGRQGRLTKVAADLRYEEQVRGVLRVSTGVATDAMPMPEPIELDRPILQHFPTRGLLLRFPQEEDPIALASLAEALRHVFPVHLGVEEGALEVVPLAGGARSLTADGTPPAPDAGLALVDLYPGGIGLIDALWDDDALVMDLLEAAHRWLSACPCQSETGCEACLRPPAAQATNPDHPPLRGAALALLGQVV